MKLSFRPTSVLAGPVRCDKNGLWMVLTILLSFGETKMIRNDGAGRMSMYES